VRVNELCQVDIRRHDRRLLTDEIELNREVSRPLWPLFASSKGPDVGCDSPEYLGNVDSRRADMLNEHSGEGAEFAHPVD
jgi:hypothetical protein